MVQSVTSGIRAVDPAARSTAPTYFYGGCPPATSDLYLYQQQPRPPPPPWPPLPPQQQGVWYLNQNQFQYHSPSPPPQQHQWDPPPPHGAHLPPPPGSFAPPPPPYYYPQSYHPQQLNQEGGAQSQQAWEYHFEAAHQLFDEIPERQSEAKFQVVESAACVALSSMQAYNVTPEVQAFPVEFAAQISKLKASLDSVRNDLHALNAAITRGQALKGRSDESLSQTIEPDKPQSPNLEPQPQQESESIVEEEEEAVEPTLDDDEDYPHLAGDDVDTDAHVELEESGETLRFNLIKAEENFLSSAGSANPSEEASSVEKFCGNADVVTSSLNDDNLGDDDVVVEDEFSGTEEDDFDKDKVSLPFDNEQLEFADVSAFCNPTDEEVYIPIPPTCASPEVELDPNVLLSFENFSEVDKSFVEVLVFDGDNSHVGGIGSYGSISQGDIPQLCALLETELSQFAAVKNTHVGYLGGEKAS